MPKGKVKTNRAKVRRRLQKQRKRRREVEKIKDAKENVLHESSQSEHLSDTPFTAVDSEIHFTVHSDEVGHDQGPVT